MNVRKTVDNLIRVVQNYISSKGETKVTEIKSMSTSNSFSRNSSDSISNVMGRTQNMI